MQQGIIDGSAPPFILLSLAAAAAGALLAFASAKETRELLWEKVKMWLLTFVLSSWLLVLLLLVRIGTRAALGISKGEPFFWGLDVLILGLATYVTSAAPVLSLVWWWYVRQTTTRPWRESPDSL